MDYLDAAVATKKSEKTIKRYVKKGTLKWKRMGSQSNSPVHVWITPSFIESISGEKDQKIEDPDIFEAESHEVDFSPTEAELTAQASTTEQKTAGLDGKEPSYKQLIESFVTEFRIQLNNQRDECLALKKELDEKDRQLKLLPDLQKQLEERERQTHIQKTSLEHQVETLRITMENQQKVVDQLQSEADLRARLAEELRLDNEQRAKDVEQLRIEKEEEGERASQLQEENARLRAETEQLKGKPSLMKWFFGRKSS